MIAKITLTVNLGEDEDWLEEFLVDSGFDLPADKGWSYELIHDAVVQALVSDPQELLREFDNVEPFTVEIVNE